MSAPTATSRPVSVEELKQAWAAVQAGQFRRNQLSAVATADPSSARRPQPPTTWAPATGERVVPVVGAAGSVGATTVALALALAAENADRPARVVECSPVTASGLAAASTAELGVHESGWRQGTRDNVLLERGGDVLVGVDEVPTPTRPERPFALTVLDVAWELGQVLATPSWLGDSVRAVPAVVVVAPATVPGFRRLEVALDLLGVDRVVTAVVGPRRKKWPKGIEHGTGLHTRRLLSTDRLVEVPADRTLAVAGIDPNPLPAPMLTAAGRLLDRADRLTPAPDTTPDPRAPEATDPDDQDHSSGERNR